MSHGSGELFHPIVFAAKSFVFAQHVPWLDNEVGDTLSCMQMERFRQHAPEADLYPIEMSWEL